ncbi:hypothetical protein PCANC_14366 [Puccinia coronata f. sp. avenae]|uniref:Uncharacterized protein n=1 Tax=Puccinia coronata f. sp. avenae TaxID=200324 RepID=A0A2N5V9E4_9BASI|nr:hypothetical protein PCANC_14366 [Puccinia coronata f. sp. avenae]
MSPVTKVPTGLPLDFYRRKWLWELPTGQQRIIPNLAMVAFLPDPSKSLFAVNHPSYDPDEDLSDEAFNEKFLEEALELYRKNPIIAAADSGDKDDVDYEGENEEDGGGVSITLNDEDNTYLVDGDWGNQYEDDEDDEDGDPEVMELANRAMDENFDEYDEEAAKETEG